jgi:hypothetical protein
MEKGKDNFNKGVAKCMPREDMWKEIITRFSMHTKQYILSYQALELHSDEINTNNKQYFSHQVINQH